MHRRTLLASIAPLAALSLTAAAPATKPGDALLVPRIHAHFDSVLVELRGADVNALTAAQRERRQVLIARLARYRDRGVFPHNYDFPGQAVPYFVDRKTGTLCAVAHLMASTGHRDLVDRVAATNNNVWVMELAGDSQFEHWLRANGVTLEEAARIQVPYMEGDPVLSSIQQASSFAPVVTASAGAIMGVNFFSNRDGHGRIRNWLGVASGITSVAVGTGMIRDKQQSRMSGFVNVGVGALSTALSTRAMFKRHSAIAARRDAERPKVAVAPVVPTAENGAGLSLNIKF